MSKREIVIRVDAKTVMLIVGCLTVGFLGHRLYHAAGQVLHHLPHLRPPAKLAHLSGPSVVELCDFESEDDLKLWKPRNVTIKRVSEHAANGQWAASISYRAGKGAPAALIEDALEDKKIRSDWSGYGELAFTINCEPLLSQDFPTFEIPVLASQTSASIMRSR